MNLTPTFLTADFMANRIRSSSSKERISICTRRQTEPATKPDGSEGSLSQNPVKTFDKQKVAEGIAMYNRIFIITLIIAASTVTGCAKFRELTRRDYAMLKDPFLDRSAVAKVDEESDVNATGVSGVAQVSDLSAAGNADKKMALVSDTRTTRTTSTTSTPPNATADFKGVRMNGMGEIIRPEGGPSLDDFIEKAAEPATAAAETAQNSAGDMADFTKFVKGQAEASGMTETAKELDEDMNEWFVKQNEEWNQQVQNVEDRATPLIGSARPDQEVAIETHPEMPALPELGYGNPAPTAGRSAPEIATPLIQHAAKTTDKWIVPTTTTPEIKSAAAPVPASPASTKSGFAPDPFAAFAEQNDGAASRSSDIQTTSGTKVPTNVANTNPFADEFPTDPKPKRAAQEQWNSFNADSGNRQEFGTPKGQWTAQENPFGNSPAAAVKPQTVPAKPTGDSGFNFDSGWRPSN